jgi:YD repeat-containing protein
VQYGYDRAGRVSEERRGSWRDGAFTLERATRFHRDRRGRATRVEISEPRDEGRTYRGSIRYRYDRAGNRVWRKGKNLPDDGPLSWKWDGAGRLVEMSTSWGSKETLTWRQHEGAAVAGPFVGLTLHESEGELDYYRSQEPITVRFAVDPAGRVVYRRLLDPERDTIETWTSFDAEGRASVVRETRFQPPFYEDPLERWETRMSYEGGRLASTERFEIVELGEGGGESAVLVKRTMHLAVGCL